jgi:hypothetical protein
MRLEINSVSPFACLSWFKKGWQIFTLNPSVFMGACGILLLFSVVPSFVPAVGLVMSFLIPFLVAGLYQIATDVKQEKPAQVTDLFQILFKFKDYIVIVRIALVGIIISLLNLSNTNEILLWIQKGGQAPSQMAVLLTVLLSTVNAMLLAFAVPLAWVSPKTSLIKILQLSFMACWQNAIPLIFYMIFVSALLILSMPIILIGWLIAFALFYLSFLQAFLEIFTPVTEQVDAESVEADEGVVEKTAEDDVVEQVEVESELTDSESNVDSNRDSEQK